MRESLLQVGQNYAFAKQENFNQHPLASIIRRQLKGHISHALGDLADGLLVDASAGAGAWAHVPWAAVFDPIVTRSATRGYYVVYLFAPNKSEIHLSLNQGTTSIMEEFGTRGLKLLKDRATLMRARVSDFATYFDVHNLDLGYKATLPKGYEAGHAFGRSYHVDSLPTEEVLQADLQKMVEAYLTLTFRGGLESSIETNNGDDDDLLNTKTITEVRRYRMHRRIDRHPEASKAAKLYHGTTCQGCDFNFSEKYGELGLGFIEAHHLRPLSTLEEGIPVKYNIATDFVVLCSNCHRMIHRTLNPADMVSFREIIARGASQAH